MAQAAIAVAHVQPVQAAGPAQPHNLPPEDNQAVEADNHNNLPPEDNQAVEEAVVEEAVEAEEANLQQDNKLQDKQPPHHLDQNPSKE